MASAVSTTITTSTYDGVEDANAIRANIITATTTPRRRDSRVEIKHRLLLEELPFRDFFLRTSMATESSSKWKAYINTTNWVPLSINDISGMNLKVLVCVNSLGKRLGISRAKIRRHTNEINTLVKEAIQQKLDAYTRNITLTHRECIQIYMFVDSIGGRPGHYKDNVSDFLVEDKPIHAPPLAVTIKKTGKVFVTIESLGKGATKSVDLIVDMDTGVHKARFRLSKTNRGDTRMRRQMLNEIAFLEHYRGVEGIVNIHDSEDVLAEEKGILGPGGTLEPYDNHIYEIPTSTPVNEIITALLSSAKGIKRLHDDNIIIRDVKTDNILMRRNRLTNILETVIADLAFAIQVTDDYIPDIGACGSQRYVPGWRMNPNFLKYVSVERWQKVDIWGFGCSICEAIHGRLPCDKIVQDCEGIYIYEGDDCFHKTRDEQAAKGFKEPEDKESLDHLIWEMLNPELDQIDTIPTMDEVIRRMEEIVSR